MRSYSRHEDKEQSRNLYSVPHGPSNKFSREIQVNDAADAALDQSVFLCKTQRSN